MNGKSVLAALTLALVSPAILPADKTPVYIEGAADDARSRTFLFEVKEQFRSSTSMRITGSRDDAFLAVKLAIVGTEQNGIAYSVVWTYKTTRGVEAYLSQAVGTCSNNRLQACARTVLAETADITE